MPVAPIRVPAQRDRSAALITARKEMFALVARARVQTVLSTPVPAAADRDVQPGAQVQVYREPPVNSWQCPYMVVVQTNKTVSVAVNGQLRLFVIDKEKIFKTPTTGATTTPNSTTLASRVEGIARTAIAAANGTPAAAIMPSAIPTTTTAVSPNASRGMTGSDPSSTGAVDNTIPCDASQPPPAQPAVDAPPLPGDSGDLFTDGAL